MARVKIFTHARIWKHSKLIFEKECTCSRISLHFLKTVRGKYIEILRQLDLQYIYNKWRIYACLLISDVVIFGLILLMRFVTDCLRLYVGLSNPTYSRGQSVTNLIYVLFYARR